MSSINIHEIAINEDLIQKFKSPTMSRGEFTERIIEFNKIVKLLPKCRLSEHYIKEGKLMELKILQSLGILPSRLDLMTAYYSKYTDILDYFANLENPIYPSDEDIMDVPYNDPYLDYFDQ
jgi:hypothetical protein